MFLCMQVYSPRGIFYKKKLTCFEYKLSCNSSIFAIFLLIALEAYLQDMAPPLVASRNN
jgi:hypothetical protein